MEYDAPRRPLSVDLAEEGDENPRPQFAGEGFARCQRTSRTRSSLALWSQEYDGSGSAHRVRRRSLQPIKARHPMLASTKADGSGIAPLKPPACDMVVVPLTPIELSK